MPAAAPNRLFFGDNLDILREHIAEASVDLIYLDPPFNSNVNYNILFREQDGAQSVAQIAAFEDTWHWGLEAEARLARDGRQRARPLVRIAPVAAGVPRRQRYDGLPDDDGAPACRTASRPQNPPAASTCTAILPPATTSN